MTPYHPHNRQPRRPRAALAAALAVVALALAALQSCSDEPSAENYYTFTGEMISDFLDNRPEQFSKFTQILQRSGLYGRVATYGTYTCFAPTNDAVDRYLAARGLSSVDALTQADCDTLSWSHLLAKTFFTTDLSEGRIPEDDMNGRPVIFTCDSDAVDAGNASYYINAAKIIARDDSVENGVVHTLDGVLTPPKTLLPEMVAEDAAVSLFTQALQLTGLADSLYAFEDPDYSISPDSVFQPQEFHRVGVTYYMYYPEKREHAFTAFVEPNSVYRAAGINTLDDLKAYAKQVYDAVYPEDAGLYDDDLTHRKNPLNRFVAYHLIPYYGAINDFTISDSGISYKTECAMTNLIDCTDWYTTLMPATIMKMSSPAEGLFINRKGVADNFTVRGARVLPFTEMKALHDQELAQAGQPAQELKQQMALNGIYHYIDQILTYNTQTRDVVFNDRIRWNVVTMSTEFLNARGRGNTDNHHLLGLKEVDGWDFHGVNPTLTLRERAVWNATASDAVDFIGQFDISFRLPPVPANTYEIRFAYGANEDRGVVQIYFGEKGDLQPMGLPIDFRTYNDPKVGWVADDPSDPEANRAIDKAMHNRGYMKEMDSWYQGGRSNGNNLRDLGYKFRKILTTQTLDPNKEYWLRIKLVLDNPEAELPLNYFEFCPKSVYAGLEAEDTH